MPITLLSSWAFWKLSRSWKLWAVVAWGSSSSELSVQTGTAADRFLPSRLASKGELSNCLMGDWRRSMQTDVLFRRLPTAGLEFGVLGSDLWPAVALGHLRPNSGLSRASAKRDPLTLLSAKICCWLPEILERKCVFSGCLICTAQELRIPGNGRLLITGLESSERLFLRCRPAGLSLLAKCPALRLRHRTAGVERTTRPFQSMRNISSTSWCCCWTGRLWWVGDGGGSGIRLPFRLNLGVDKGTIGGCLVSILDSSSSSSSDGQTNWTSSSRSPEGSRKSTTPSVICLGCRWSSDVL